MVQLHDQAQELIQGAIVLRSATISSAEEWCDYYGVPIENGVAVLFKAVQHDFRSQQGFLYAPGTIPIAPDWDGGKAECGGGLHFVSRPTDGLQFYPEGTRFIACPVLASEIAVHPNAKFPNKIKAPRGIAPIYEVDRDGVRIESNAVSVTKIKEKESGAK